ncbi:MAG TPA: CPBP family intramembrane glutamic endopeptidase [Chloroflexota bacterium]|nr:CPBP family intramembrane glutamic endopeptidase [Chloroflexota bacterium]
MNKESAETLLRVPWGIGTGLLGLLVAYAVAVAGTTGESALPYFAHKHHYLLGEAVSYQFLTLGVGIAAVVIVLVWNPQDRVTALGFHLPGRDRVGGAVLGGVVATFGGIALVSGLFDTFFPSYHLHGNTQNVFPHTPHNLPILAVIGLGLWIAVEAPLTEELLFRGILYQGLRHFFHRWLPYQWAVFLGAIGSGAVFGLAHFEPHTLPVLIFLGIVLAYTFQYGRTLFASAIVHGIVNFLALSTLLHG